MLALLTALLLFLYMTMVGMAAIQAIGLRFGVLRQWLFSPVSGLAVLVVASMVLSQTGLPARNFALGLAIGGLGASLGVFWWRTPILPIRPLLPIGVALTAGLVYIGWQAIPYGFNWAGYGNADAAAYCSSASRLVDHGLFETPSVKDLLGRDYTQTSWFQFGPGLYRCGFDLFLAWAAAVLRMNPFAIYMPVMLCLGMAQISAAAALVLDRPSLRTPALLTTIFLVMSPLFGFSVIAQVGPQVGGLALLLGLCCVTLRRGMQPVNSWQTAFRQATIVALLGLALGVFYPEALPFWVLSYIALKAALSFKGSGGIWLDLRIAGIAALLMVLVGRANVLRGYFASIFALRYSQSLPLNMPQYSGFEVFKLPHGCAALFGLCHYQRLPNKVWLSVLIVLGFALAVICIKAGIHSLAQLMPYSLLLLTMVLTAVFLYGSPYSFGLFKMGMYIQPVLMASLAIAAARLSRRWLMRAVIAYGLISFVPHTQLVEASTGALAGLSSSGVTSPAQLSGNVLLVTDTPTSVPASLLTIYFKGVPQEQLNGRPRLPEMQWVQVYTKPLLGRLNPYHTEISASDALLSQVAKAYRTETWRGFTFDRTTMERRPEDRIVLATVNPRYGHFNAVRRNPSDTAFFVYDELGAVRNYMVFINSDKSHDYYVSSIGASYYALEGDLYRSGESFYGMGRYLLFEVLNPAPTVRVRISLTRTIMGHGRTRLPQDAVVLTDRTESLGMVGAGAASVFSEPVHTVPLNGHHYLAIDLKDELISPPNNKAGLMNLYNRQIPLDVRKFVAYGRDISVISEEEYSRLKRIRTVSKWPDDLFSANGVEFSGFYEDGWVSDHALIKLGSSNAGERVVIRGMVPALGMLERRGNVLRVSVDGAPGLSQDLKPGSFEVSIPIPSALSVTTVKLDFAFKENLPPGDDRPIAAQIQMLGIK